MSQKAGDARVTRRNRNDNSDYNHNGVDQTSVAPNHNNNNQVPQGHFPTKGCSITLFLSLGSLAVAVFFGFTISPTLRSDQQWWETGVIYQIYPRSFQDSDGDGVGDLKGIESRLGYLQDLGIAAIWLSPVYTSPMRDFGYDIANFTDIDPVFGTLEDFDNLIDAIHKRGMKLIMDYIPNHSSSDHKWFQESRKGGKDNKYADYYVWSDGKVLENGTRVPPNNWLGVFGGSVWTFDEMRGQYYLHQFIPEQPDLNYRNPDVRKDMMDVLKFWTRKGVDGFRIDAIDTLWEVEDISLNEPRSFRPGVPPHHSEYLDHIYTRNQPEIYDVVQSWRDMFNEFEKETGKHIYMVCEIYDETDDLRYWKKYYEKGTDQPFNFGLIMGMNRQCGGKCLHKIVNHVVSNLPKGKWLSWVMGNHDRKRISTIMGDEFVNAMNLLLLSLPGTPTTYYGEEIGAKDIYVPFEETQDPWAIRYGKDYFEDVTRDPCRSPMQWNSTKNAGFSTAGKCWLPVHKDYKTHNVQVQLTDPTSTLSQYKQLIQLRGNESMKSGNMLYAIVNEHIFSFVRQAGGKKHAKYLIAINFGSKLVTENYRISMLELNYNETAALEKGKEVDMNKRRVRWPKTGTVVFNTQNFEGSYKKAYSVGNKIDLDEITLKPAQGLIIKFFGTDL